MERCANPSTQLEIDEAILDYLLYTAIRALLEYSERGHDRARTQAQPDLPLQMVDSFLAMFRSIHPNQHGSEELQFRLRLLKFTALFTTRSASSNISPPRFASELMMRQPQERANAFREDETIAHLESPLLAEALAKPAADKFTTGNPSKTKPSVSLLDTLPSFMSLSAAQNTAAQDTAAQNSLQGTNVTELWMRLAARYMAHAFAEQYLVYNSQRPEDQVLHEAFAYPFDAESYPEEGSDEWAVNAMFYGEDDVVEGWEDIRQEHMRALKPGPGVSLHEHLKALVAHNLPLSTFEDTVMTFLERLLSAYPKPSLVQLEAGKVDGLSEEQTRTLQRKVGFS